MIRTVFLLCLSLTLTWASLPAAVADEEQECDPYPIGRCGGYEGETVIFCYIVVQGRYVNATDPDVVAFPALVRNLGVQTGISDVDQAAVYVRNDTSQAFLDDPMYAPIPYKTLFQESNNVDGLQPVAFKCGKWNWITSGYNIWGGPVGVVNMLPDEVVL